LKYLDIFNDYSESDYDDIFVYNNYELVHDSSKNLNEVYEVEFEYLTIEPDYKKTFRSITKIYESKYNVYIEGFYFYVINKSKVKSYKIIKIDISELIYRGNKTQKH
jgi:hypothetical protein